MYMIAPLDLHFSILYDVLKKHTAEDAEYKVSLKKHTAEDAEYKVSYN